MQRYAARLNAVEINSSFYRAHRSQTHARWAASVPEHFRFSVKLPKAITHEHRLQGCAGLLEPFLDECGHRLVLTLLVEARVSRQVHAQHTGGHLVIQHATEALDLNFTAPHAFPCLLDAFVHNEG